MKASNARAGMIVEHQITGARARVSCVDERFVYIESNYMEIDRWPVQFVCLIPTPAEILSATLAAQKPYE